MIFVNEATPAGLPALFDSAQGCWIDYAALRSLVAARSTEFVRKTKQLVLCFLPNSADGIIDMLALLDAGQAVALLDPTLPQALFTPLLDSYGPELVLGVDCPAVEAAGRQAGVRGASKTASGLNLIEIEQPPRSPIHPELSLLLSTSGSTGSPKFVRLSWRNITANAAAIAKVLEIDSGQRILAHLPLHYSFGFSVISSHLLAGASIVPTPETLASGAAWQLFRQQQCTALPGVPSHFDILRRLDIDRLKVPALKCLMQAGGRMRSEVIESFASKMAARGGRLFVMYGQTEAGPRMTTLPSSEVLNSLGSVGPALPGGRLEIRGDKGEVLPAGETGEVVYFGPNVMMGYATTRKDLTDGYQMEDGLHTGDLGYLDARGYLTITGRANRFAKVHGVRVSLDEVEAILSNRGPAAAVELEDNKILVVVVEPQDVETIHAQLVDALRLTPVSLVVRSAGALPTKPNGKIDYKKIPGLL